MRSIALQIHRGGTVQISNINAVAVLVHNQKIYSLVLLDKDNSILWNGEQRQTAVTKKTNAIELAKLIQKIVQGLNGDEKRSSFRKQKELNPNNILPFKEISYINPYSFKSHPRQIALSGLLNKGQGPYKHIHKDLNDYFKVYLVLNPESNLSSSDVKDIDNLISSLFLKNVPNKKATIKDHHTDKWIRRYKGFVIRDNRRRFKESQEKFAPKDSIENDYRPKRGRGGDYGGGGAGRTAIPYIRHRGDIYERLE
ncbi:unnamed protein product [Euphydryas editha]|uniref:Uncharacterized protein n=1 Tax=Euphydryas editha TaxID=104508 RepID=A0AAU9UXA2_EUPED|nr:unnamed protein product [Euphydryas editha]